MLLSIAGVFIDRKSPVAVAIRAGYLPLLLLSQVWMLAYPLWIAWRRRPDVVRLPSTRAIRREALRALLIFPVAFGVMPAMVWLVTRLSGSTTMPAGPWDAASTTFSQLEWIAFLVIGITVAPMAEELFYRGMFYNTLRKWFHPILAATIQAVVFGFAHRSGLAVSLAIGTCALVLVLLYEWRRTLLTPILVHASVNTVGLSLLALAVAAEANAPRMGLTGDASPSGCVATRVLPGSPAETAGLRTGDVITAVDGTAVRDIASVAGLVRRHQVGESVVLDYVRDGTARRVEVMLQRLKQ